MAVPEMGRKSAQRFEGGGQVPGSSGYPACFFCIWKFVKDWSLDGYIADEKVLIRYLYGVSIRLFWDETPAFFTEKGGKKSIAA